MPPALETSAARVPLEVPSMGALMMMGCLACGNQVESLERVSGAMFAIVWGILIPEFNVCL
jgi:hypothetical protein